MTGVHATQPQPQISVVIPHFNQEQHLARCLEALSAQEGAFVLREIIVVDNGSARLPVSVCERFAAVVLLEEAARGPGAARNLGAAHASGDVLAFVDADCVPAPGWLAAIATQLRDAPEDTVLGGDVRIGPEDGPLTQIAAYESVFAYRMDKYIARQGFTGTGNLAVRRSAFFRVGPFCGIERAEDRDWGQRATALGLTLRFVPQMRVYHPARDSFAELGRKWDRHLSHDFAELAGRRLGVARWVLRAAAVAVSPLVAGLEVIASDRLASPRDRMAALVCLARIRIYRARRMLALAFGTAERDVSQSWM